MADIENSKLRIVTLWGVTAAVAAGVWYQATFVTETRAAVALIQKTITDDAQAHERDREQMVGAIREVRDEVRKLVTDAVAVRQATAWLETWQIVLDGWMAQVRADNPTLKLVPVKVPPLPR